MIKIEKKHYGKKINCTESSFQFKYSAAVCELRKNKRNQPSSKQMWGWQVKLGGVAYEQVTVRKAGGKISSTLAEPWELPVLMPPPEVNV